MKRSKKDKLCCLVAPKIRCRVCGKRYCEECFHAIEPTELPQVSGEVHPRPCKGCNVTGGFILAEVYSSKERLQIYMCNSCGKKYTYTRNHFDCYCGGKINIPI